MASWQPYGYAGKPGTCLWCGRKLYYQTVIDPASTEPYPRNLVRAEHAGRYGDDHFDTMSCGYLFGDRLADLGKRLAPRTAQEQETGS